MWHVIIDCNTEEHAFSPEIIWSDGCHPHGYSNEQSSSICFCFAKKK